MQVDIVAERLAAFHERRIVSLVGLGSKIKLDLIALPRHTHARQNISGEVDKSRRHLVYIFYLWIGLRESVLKSSIGHLLTREIFQLVHRHTLKHLLEKVILVFGGE